MYVSDMPRFDGQANHNGGSCQASLSYDSGSTWTVIKSWVGGCPILGQNYQFTIPASAPGGRAIFAWWASPKT